MEHSERIEGGPFMATGKYFPQIQKLLVVLFPRLLGFPQGTRDAETFPTFSRKSIPKHSVYEWFLPCKESQNKGLG